MRVVIAGAGLMGAQIGSEYALGGHDVVCVARRTDAVNERVNRGLALIAEHGLASPESVAAARGRIGVTSELESAGDGVDVVVESIVEDLAAKVELLRQCAELFPNAILASNTSSLPITKLGEGAGAPERTIGTHYWNPPLLMPLVELIRGEQTADAVVERVTAVLRALGKRPVLVDRDVPGFVWNRLQLALVREAVWIVENGVAAPETVDEIVRDGLARRWHFTGPFETMSLGGPDTFRRIGNLLFPELSAATAMEDPTRWLIDDRSRLDQIRTRRDTELAAELQREMEKEASAGK